MINFNVCKSKIIMGTKIMSDLSSLMLGCPKSCKAFVITDTNVSEIYLEYLKSQLKKLNLEVHYYIIPAGEFSKSLKTVENIYEKLSFDLISKNDIIISLGGGVVSDISGFVASTYKRGIKLVNIPTSFLAMIDASIGGKNAVNLNSGKNLVGSFYFPDLILIDYSFLNTLPKKELNSGIAEAIKCGAIFDEKLFDILEKEKFEDNIENIIYRSILVKKKLVEEDQFDSGKRMLLNFGHTIGHAVESLSEYKNISHGDAVSIGMNVITKISEELGLTSTGAYERLKNVCEKYSLPTQNNFSIENLSETILQDKKNFGEYINLVILKNIGNSFLFELPSSNIINFLEGREIYF